MKKKSKVLKPYSTFATLLLMVLPTMSQERYTCDDMRDSTCIMDGVVDINGWEFDPYMPGQQIYILKFTSSHFDELTSATNVIYDYYLDGSSITNIDLSGNHIKKVEKFHFTVGNLLVANLSRNEIENLDSSAIFKAHIELRSLDLSFNRISSIISDAFEGLSALTLLNLNDNQVKVITAFVFAPLVQLNYLELSGNLIEKFEDYPFVELVDLQEICLAKNNFAEFNFDIFESNNNLREISLGDNSGNEFLSLIGHINFTVRDVKLSKIMLQSNTTVPARFVSIKNSKLSELVIPTIVENVVATNSSITNLLISDNNSSLRMGDFSRNLLTGQLSFEACPKLKTLDLSFNQIQSVTFSNRSLITNLNLSHNNLTNIHPTMTNLTELQVLDLSFNCIEKFEIGLRYTLVQKSNTTFTIFFNCQFCSNYIAEI